MVAGEEAAELEIVNTPKETWPRMELHKHKRAAFWHGKHLGAETTEADVEVSAWDVWFALALF